MFAATKISLTLFCNPNANVENWLKQAEVIRAS